MNGSSYLRPKFTLPASEKTSETRWDLSFLTKEEFITKYKISDAEYRVLVNGYCGS